MRHRSALLRLFCVYAATGPLLGILGIVAVIGTLHALQDTRRLGSVSFWVKGSDVFEFGPWLRMWLIGLLPASLSAALMCLAMLVWPRVRDSRALRVPVAAMVGAGVSALCFRVVFSQPEFPPQKSEITWLVAAIGAASAALLAYLIPKSCANSHLTIRSSGP
jgi:hypothetical protein